MSTLRDLFTATETRWIPGIALALLIAVAASRLGALSVSGVVAATLVGGGMVAFGGWWPGVVLVAFFVSASALSMVIPATASGQARGKRRDAVQVLANGGLAAFLAVGSTLAANPAPLLAASLGAIAGATADTWGTESGRLSRTPPRLVTTWRAVAPGTSGAVSGIGTLGSALGGLLIGGISALGYALGWSVPGLAAIDVLVLIAIAGLAGSIVDSVLGATVQVRYRCPACDLPTERRVHTCGTATIQDNGWRWIDNDVVNFLAIAGAAIVAFFGAGRLG